MRSTSPIRTRNLERRAPVQDLSGLAKGWNSTGSMSGSNMITPHTTDTGADPLPGSTSEATEGVTTHSPAMDIAPASQAYHAKLQAVPADHPANLWKTVPSAADTDMNWTPNSYPDR